MRQKQIDWADASYRKLLAEVPFPAGIRRVGADTLRAVLQAIYEVDRGRPCWPGQARLAEMAGCCERSVREALSVLEDRLGLIVSYRAKPPGSMGRQTMTHYVIIWTELEIRRQLGNRPLPVDRDPLPVDRDPLPVDRDPLPVDRDLDRNPLPVDPNPLPVDPNPLPVDRRAYNIYARPKRNGKGTEEGEELPVPVPAPPTVAGCSGFAEGIRSDAASTSELWSNVDLAADPRLDLPELHEARLREVSPLPARWQVADGTWRDMRGSVFSAVKLDTLKHPGQLARWHQRQLGAPSPVCGNTEADLLLVWCAARHAVTCPAEEIQRNRVAYFVHLVSRRKWLRVLRHLDWALAQLSAIASGAEAAAGISSECVMGVSR